IAVRGSAGEPATVESKLGQRGKTSEHGIVLGNPDLISRLHHIRCLAARYALSESAGQACSRRIRHLTPVRTVAIGWRPFGEPFEGPLSGLEKRPHGNGADFYWSQARS